MAAGSEIGQSSSMDPASLDMTDATGLELFICKYCQEDFPSKEVRYAHQVDSHWRDMITQCEACVKGFLLGREPDPLHQCHPKEQSRQSDESPAERNASIRSTKRGTSRRVQSNKTTVSKAPGERDASSCTTKRRTSKKVQLKKTTVSIKKDPKMCNQQMVFSCKDCSHVCQSVLSMLNHKQSHHSSATQCHYCHLSCRNEQSLVEHLKLHANQRWHFCSLCAEGFDRHSLLLDHHMMLHSDGDSKHAPQQDTEMLPNPEMDPASSDEKVTKIATESVPMTDSSNSTELDVPKSTGHAVKTYSCRYCFQKFRIEATYHQHVNDSHPKKHECETCGRRFVRRCEVKIHMKHHNEDRSFTCQYCAKSFKRQPHLDCHILSHTGEKKFQCKVCGKAYKAKRTLLGHEMKHLGKQPFQCKDCGLKFTLKSSLLKHEECHLRSRVRVNCPKCGKDFSSKESLAIHNKAIHLKIKQFVCETCGTVFAFRSQLEKHQMIHRNEKPFQCSFCDKCFRLSYSRMLHERQHTNKKPFRCSLCNKAYATRGRLGRHCETHDTKPRPLSKPEYVGGQEGHLIPVHSIPEAGCSSHFALGMEKTVQQNHCLTTPRIFGEQHAVASAVMVCNICASEFSTYGDLLTHQETHSLAQLENHIGIAHPDTVSVMLSFISGVPQAQ